MEDGWEGFVPETPSGLDHSSSLPGAVAVIVEMTPQAFDCDSIGGLK